MDKISNEKESMTILVIPAHWTEKEIANATGKQMSSKIASPSENGNMRAIAAWEYTLLKINANLNAEKESKTPHDILKKVFKYRFIFVGRNRGEGKPSGSKIVQDTFLEIAGEYFYELITKKKLNRADESLKEIDSWIKWKNKNIKSEEGKAVVAALESLLNQIDIVDKSVNTKGNIQIDLKTKLQKLNYANLKIKVISNRYHNIGGRLIDLADEISQSYPTEFISAEEVLNYANSINPTLLSAWNIDLHHKQKLPFGLGNADKQERKEGLILATTLQFDKAISFLLRKHLRYFTDHLYTRSTIRRTKDRKLDGNLSN